VRGSNTGLIFTKEGSDETVLQTTMGDNPDPDWSGEEVETPKA